jgi:hypothetical protein
MGDKKMRKWVMDVVVGCFPNMYKALVPQHHTKEKRKRKKMRKQSLL